MSIPYVFSRMSITARMLSWSLVLMLIFYSITIYFFFGIRGLVSTTDQIVNKDLEVVAVTEQLVDTTLLFVENQRKYQILGRDQYYEASLHHLSVIEDLLQDFPGNVDFSGFESQVQGLRFSTVNGDNAQLQEFSLPDEEALSAWVQDITNLRASYLENINERMQSMYDRGLQAQTLGFAGMGLVTFLAVAGSLALAFFLNKTMREFRSGISRLARNQEFEPVRVASHGELGQLAQAFNRMGLKLKREEEMRSQFISMLSHEIRTPLTSIRESINLVLEGLAGGSPREQSRFLEIAHKESIRLSMLLQRLMQASTLESGSIKMKFAAINIDKLLNEAIERIHPTAQAGDVRVRVEGSEALGLMVLADEEHIQQVLFNLLGNAVKFSPLGTEVNLSFALIPERQLLQVSISDQGPGVPDDERDLVFERYYSGKNADNITDGAGLGLSIARHIIRAHNGELWLESTSTSGSVFSFTLPLAGPQQPGR